MPMAGLPGIRYVDLEHNWRWRLGIYLDAGSFVMFLKKDGPGQGVAMELSG
jgi:hypothetical protein